MLDHGNDAPSSKRYLVVLPGARGRLHGLTTRSKGFLDLPSTVKLFNNLGDLLLAQRQPKAPQREEFCHGFATLAHAPNRNAPKVQSGVLAERHRGKCQVEPRTLRRPG